MESLKEKTAKGLFWGGMNNGIQQLVGLVFGIILARLLSDSDYGMMAMISVFSLIATELQSSGFKTALANLKDPQPEDYNSVFWFNIIVGTSIYIILFFSAPLIADFYHTPELIPLCRYAFLGFVFSSFGCAQSARLFKNIMAKQQAQTGMIAVLLSSTIGVIMAWQGFSYWALATQTNVYVLTCTLLYWHYSDWRPNFKIDFGPVRKMFRFSCKILASAILVHINNNVLNILLGRFFGTSSAGNYNQAYQWNFKCFSLIQGMIQQVAQPVLVEIRDDEERRMRVFRKMMRFTAFISFPLLFGLSLVSEEFIIIAITEKWLVSAGMLKMLCISGAFMPLGTLMSNMVISRGNSGTYMWSSVMFGIAQISLMVILYPYGIIRMVEAYVALNILWVFIWDFIVWRFIGYNPLMFIKDIAPYLLSAAAVMYATYFITSGFDNLVLLLISRIIIATLLYYVVMRVAGSVILKECTEFAMKKFKHS